MKLTITIGFLICFSANLFSQEKEKRISYETEITKLLEEINTDSLEDFDTWRYKKIGNYYDSLGNKELALNYYRTALVRGELDYGYRKRSALKELARYFLKQEMYDSVLYYFSIVKSAKPVRIGCGMGRIYLMTDFYYWPMAALAAKGDIDSAIRIFLPFAFQEWTNNEGTEISTEHLFENDYHCKMVQFIGLLNKKYGIGRIYRQINDFTDKKNFTLIKQSYPGSDYYKMGYNLQIGDLEYFLYGYDEEIKDYEADKKNIRTSLIDHFDNQIRNSFIYRYVLSSMAL